MPPRLPKRVLLVGAYLEVVNHCWPIAMSLLSNVEKVKALGWTSCLYDFVTLCSFTFILLMIEVRLMKLRVEKQWCIESWLSLYITLTTVIEHSPWFHTTHVNQYAEYADYAEDAEYAKYADYEKRKNNHNMQNSQDIQKMKICKIFPSPPNKSFPSPNIFLVFFLRFSLLHKKSLLQIFSSLSFSIFILVPQKISFLFSSPPQKYIFLLEIFSSFSFYFLSQGYRMQTPHIHCYSVPYK